MLHFFPLFLFPYRKKARQLERDRINDRETFGEAESASIKKKPRRCRHREQIFGHSREERSWGDLKE